MNIRMRLKFKVAKQFTVQEFANCEVLATPHNFIVRTCVLLFYIFLEIYSHNHECSPLELTIIGNQTFYGTVVRLDTAKFTRILNGIVCACAKV